MLIYSIILTIFSNAVTSRRDKSILYNRIAIITLLYSSLLAYGNLYITNLDTNIGLYELLFHTTLIFQLLSLLISGIILYFINKTGDTFNNLIYPKFKNEYSFFMKAFFIAKRSYNLKDIFILLIFFISKNIFYELYFSLNTLDRIGLIIVVLAIVIETIDNNKPIIKRIINAFIKTPRLFIYIWLIRILKILWLIFVIECILFITFILLAFALYFDLESVSFIVKILVTYGISGLYASLHEMELDEPSLILYGYENVQYKEYIDEAAYYADWDKFNNKVVTLGGYPLGLRHRELFNPFAFRGSSNFCIIGNGDSYYHGAYHDNPISIIDNSQPAENRKIVHMVANPLPNTENLLIKGQRGRRGLIQNSDFYPMNLHESAHRSRPVYLKGQNGNVLIDHDGQLLQIPFKIKPGLKILKP